MTWSKFVSREGVDITTISAFDSVFYKHIWECMPRQELFFTYCSNKSFTHYTGVDIDSVGRFVYQKYFNSPKQIKKYYKEGVVFLKKIKTTANIWRKRLAKKNDSVFILRAYKEFLSQFSKINEIYSITSFLAFETWQNDFESMLSKMIARNNLNHKQEQILFSVNKPWKKTALIELQECITRGESAKKLADKFQFMRSWSIIWYRKIDESWIRSLAVKKGAEISSLSIKELLSLLHPDKKEKKFIELAPYISFFKDWRDDVRRFHAYSWVFMFENVAKKLKADYSDLGYLTLEEIGDILKHNQSGNEIVQLIQKRKNGECIVTLSDRPSRMKVIDGEIPQKYKEIMNVCGNQSQNDIVMGMVVQKGIAKGRVIIIKSFHDIKKVQDGDILVANTTHPNYLPAMQKAAAFVTNEGGIISHAAIVAREMKKPCIVGTKVATKILKDGDLVEVDANKGTVKVMKHD